MVDRCWASDVSPCSGGLSSEHVITRGLWLSKGLTIEGLPGREGPVTIGLDSAVVRALCKHHNERLSEVDTAAIDFVNGWRRLTEERDRIRHTSGAVWGPMHYEVDGWRLERWALKTVFNLARFKRRELVGWEPESAVARYIFGLASTLPEGAGLYVVPRVGDCFEDEERLAIGFGKRERDTHPTAALMSLRGGLRMLVTWSCSPTDLGEALSFDGATRWTEEAYRLKQINFGFEGLRMSFDWSRDSDRARDPALAALRERYPSPPRPGSRRR